VAGNIVQPSVSVYKPYFDYFYGILDASLRIPVTITASSYANGYKYLDPLRDDKLKIAYNTLSFINGQERCRILEKDLTVSYAWKMSPTQAADSITF
jgi:hypothetical protein